MFFILFQHIDSLDCDDDNVHDNNDTSHLHCIFQSTVRYIILFDSKNAPEMIMTALYTAEPPTAHNSSSAAYRLCHRHSMESYCPKFWCSDPTRSLASRACLTPEFELWFHFALCPKARCHHHPLSALELEFAVLTLLT